MGAVASRPDEGAAIYIRDQSRFSVAAVHITNARGQTVLRLSPNAFPATRYSAHRDIGDDSPIEYVQDPDVATIIPAFLLRFSCADELNFTFSLVIRQGIVANSLTAPSPTQALPVGVDTSIAGLTYIFASTQKEVDNLVVREFHTNPNLHKNPNVELIGDYTTAGSPSVQLDWTWKWTAPKASEDRGGGWRNTCSFVEYDQRSNRLNTLASFNYWVHNAVRTVPKSPLLEMGAIPPRLRVPSAQSIESRTSNISDSEGEGSYKDLKEPQSPGFDPIPENGLGLVPSATILSSTTTSNAVKVDVATCKPGDDLTISDDGPVFRATMRSLEQKTGGMRLRMKKVLRTAEAAEVAQQACNQAVVDFTEALREAAASNANAVQPALDHYFEKIAKEILRYERTNAFNLQKLIIDPISKLYNIEIKQADFKKREFDEESKEYYSYVSKYLGQRSESLKEKKQKQSDEKYQAKRRTFELKRFDYSTFMHDLHGGRKDQEVLSQLTKYADAQARGFLATAKRVEEMAPHLDALMAEVRAADQDFQLQRAEREEKRRMLEINNKGIAEEGSSHAQSLAQPIGEGGTSRVDTDHQRSGSYTMAAHMSQSPPANGWLAVQAPGSSGLAVPSAMAQSLSSSPGGKFKGIRDLEENGGSGMNGGLHRKEGLLWALSRPGAHVDPKGLTKPGWHKFWIVLDQGKLSEYVNWKDRLDLHMEPIDLRVASVREARSSERRFCFEVITPQFTRVYQAPSEEDMRSWIAAINNALQSAFEAKSIPQMSLPSPVTQTSSTRKDIAAVLTGKSSSFSGHRQSSNPSRQEASKAVHRHATVGDRPSFRRPEDLNDSLGSALLQRIRSADEGNKLCADCGSEFKVDWCSINLGVLLCIECSGIHRSLGTHISKVRSLTLDTHVFTADLIELFLAVGNRVSNMVWEAKLDRFLKPSPHSTRDQRLHFITAKYTDRTYVQPSAIPTMTVDDHLLTSIKRNDAPGVLHALAQRANPNAHDRSRSVHAVYLALAAADPASPASTLAHAQSTPASALKTSPGSAGAASPQPRKPFAIAELLLQNGADLPVEAAPFPLSTAAQAYIEFKHEQRLGKIAMSPVPAVDRNGDSLTALPIIGAGNIVPTNERPRERERLIKRNSATRSSRPGSTVDAWDGLMKK